MYHLARNTWQTASRNTAHEAMNTLNADLRLASTVIIVRTGRERSSFRPGAYEVSLQSASQRPLNEA